jgi:ribonuclease HI
VGRFVFKEHVFSFVSDHRLAIVQKETGEKGDPMTENTLKEVAVFTDGACLGNPGPGGCGVLLVYGPHRKELSFGYKETTNNRMELLAAIHGLEALKERCDVSLFSDSRYLVDSLNKGWVYRWKRNGWMRNKGQRASNADLWERLLASCQAHQVRFYWVKGHAGHEENERCDTLAQEAARQPDLQEDEGYEKEKSPTSSLFFSMP